MKRSGRYQLFCLHSVVLSIFRFLLAKIQKFAEPMRALAAFNPKANSKGSLSAPEREWLEQHNNPIGFLPCREQQNGLISRETGKVYVLHAFLSAYGCCLAVRKQIRADFEAVVSSLSHVRDIMLQRAARGKYL